MKPDHEQTMKLYERNRVGRLVSNAVATLGTKGILTREQVEEKFDNLDDQIDFLNQFLDLIGGPAYRPAFFTIEGYDEDHPPLPGFTCGESWNGWAHPYFTKETAMKMTQGPLGLWDNDDRAYYQPETNQFIWPTGDEDEPWLEIDCTLVNGEPCWAIGAGWWVWDEVDDPHLRDKLVSFIESHDGYFGDYDVDGIADVLLEEKEELLDIYGS